MKPFKYIITISFFLFTAFTTLQAQNKPANKMERLKAYKVEFITTRVDLSPEEAQVFWPVYNAYSKELTDLKRARVKKMKAVLNGRSYADISDDDVLKLIDIGFAFQQKELDLKKAYDKKFKAVLPVKKVGMYYKAERDFKKEVIKRLSQRNRQAAKNQE